MKIIISTCNFALIDQVDNILELYIPCQKIMLPFCGNQWGSKNKYSVGGIIWIIYQTHIKIW